MKLHRRKSNICLKIVHTSFFKNWKKSADNMLSCFLLEARDLWRCPLVLHPQSVHSHVLTGFLFQFSCVWLFEHYSLEEIPLSSFVELFFKNTYFKKAEVELHFISRHNYPLSGAPAPAVMGGFKASQEGGLLFVFLMQKYICIRWPRKSFLLHATISLHLQAIMTVRCALAYFRRPRAVDPGEGQLFGQISAHS